MDTIYRQWAGLDVHKKSVVATILIEQAQGGLHKEPRTFETTTSNLLALSDWMISKGGTHIAVESTGNFGS